MSTDYMFVTPVSFEKVLDAAKELGWEITIPSWEPRTCRCFYDGDAYLYAHTHDGIDTGFTRYGSSRVCKMIEALQEKLDTRIIDEYEYHEEFMTKEKNEE